MIGIDCKTPSKIKPWQWARLIRKQLFGSADLLANMYQTGNKELLEILDEWHKKYATHKIAPKTTHKTVTTSNHSSEMTARNVGRLGIGCFGLIITTVGLLFCFPYLSIAFGLGLPLIAVGLLCMAPYYLLQKRWMIGMYMGLLALAISLVVYRLHAPLGPHMKIPAHIPAPGKIPGLLVREIWTVFHATIAIVSVGILIVLDIATDKARATNRKTLGGNLFGIVIAIGISLSPVNFRVEPKASTGAASTPSTTINKSADAALEQPEITTNTKVGNSRDSITIDEGPANSTDTLDHLDQRTIQQDTITVEQPTPSNDPNALQGKYDDSQSQSSKVSPGIATGPTSF